MSPCAPQAQPGPHLTVGATQTISRYSTASWGQREGSLCKAWRPHWKSYNELYLSYVCECPLIISSFSDLKLPCLFWQTPPPHYSLLPCFVLPLPPLLSLLRMIGCGFFTLNGVCRDLLWWLTFASPCSCHPPVPSPSQAVRVFLSLFSTSCEVLGERLGHIYTSMCSVWGLAFCSLF